MFDTNQFKNHLKDYLTFYHECLVPKHDFFASKNNQNSEDEFIIISSPSRMGNHALLSMLDSHPDIPRVPGEDSFLRHSFFKCSDDMQDFLSQIRSKKNTDYIRMLSSFPANVDKWKELKKLHASQEKPEVYAGVQYPTDQLVVTDYQDTLVDIDYDAYVNYLDESKSQIAQFECYADVFMIYLSALMQLDPNQPTSRFKGIYANSGMRRQCLWLCRNFENVKIITSIRQFNSYAISHIRSRYKTVDFRPEYIKEAWDHWYHKLIDYFYIKAHYPTKIMLVPFEDISGNTQKVANEISRFLGIEPHPNMLNASILGHQTKGNSSKRRNESDLGKFYASKEMLPDELLPERVSVLQDALEMSKY